MTINRDEIVKIIDVLGQRTSKLGTGLRLNGYFVAEGSILVSVDGIDEDVRSTLILASEGATVVFETPPMPLLVGIFYKFTCLVVLASMAFMGVVIGVGFRVPTITQDLAKSSSKVENAWTVFKEFNELLLKSMQGRRLQQKSVLSTFVYFEIVYKGKHDMELNPDVLTRIKEFENGLKDLPPYRRLCQYSVSLDAGDYCEYGVSIVNHAWPSVVVEDNIEIVAANGKGETLVSLTMAVESSHKSGSKLIFPMDMQGDNLNSLSGRGTCEDLDSKCPEWQARGQCRPLSEHEVFMQDFCPRICGNCGATGGTVEAVRSVFSFLSPLTSKPGSSVSEELRILVDLQNELAENAVDYTEEFLDKHDEILPFRILYSGAGMEAITMGRIKDRDLMLSIGSFLFTFAYASIYTRSIFLATMGLFLVILCLPMSLSIFFMLTGTSNISIVNGLALFMLVGIGSDMLFVWTDFWEAACTEIDLPINRLKFLYKHAATTTGAATITTAVSFFSNLTSFLDTLREFGFIVGLSVVMAWLIVLLTFPPLLIINDTLKLWCLRRKQNRKTGVVMILPTDSRGLAMGTPVSEHSSPYTSVTGQALTRSQISETTAWQSMLFTSTKSIIRVGQASAEVVSKPLSRLGRVVPKFVHQFRILIMVGFWCFTLATLVTSLFHISADAGTPDLLPKSHNNVVVKQVLKSFFPVSFEDAEAARIKKINICTDLRRSDCALYKCLTVNPVLGSEKKCSCAMTSALGGTREEAQSIRLDALAAGRTDTVSTLTVSNLIPLVEEVFRGSSPTPVLDLGRRGRMFAFSKPLRTVFWEKGDEAMDAFVTFESLEIPKCRASFSNLDGVVIKSIIISNGTEDALNHEGLNEACCQHCMLTSGCEFWVRTKSGQDYLCEIKRDPGTHRLSSHAIGGWSSNDRSVAKFKDLGGKEIGQFKRMFEWRTDDEEINVWCWRQCCDDRQCVFWVQQPIPDSNEVICSLRVNPGKHKTVRGTRGGWGCSVGPHRVENWDCTCGRRGCHATAFGSEQGYFPINRVSARSLQSSPSPGFRVPVNERQRLYLVFGVRPLIEYRLIGPHQGATYEFKENFRLSDPWAQRAAVSACTKFPPHLEVAETICWISEFKERAIETGKEFPIRSAEEFDAEVRGFARSGTIQGFAINQFIIADGLATRAFYTVVVLDVSSSQSVHLTMELLKRWDVHFDEFNDAAEESIRGVFHTCSLWVDATIGTSIQASIVSSLSLSLACVLVFTTLFSRSLRTGFLVLGLVFAIINFMLFFIIVILDQKFGGIEAMSVIIFIGICVDYLLHLSHLYNTCIVVCADESSLDDVENESTCMRMAMIASMPGLNNSNSPSNQSRHSLRTVENFKLTPADTKKGIAERTSEMEKFVRMSFALDHVGNAVVGSAITTLGCASFLLFAVIRPFFKMGLYLIVLIFFAIFTALFVLTAHMTFFDPRSAWTARLMNRVQELIVDGPQQSAQRDERNNLTMYSLPAQSMSCMNQFKHKQKFKIRFGG